MVSPTNKQIKAFDNSLENGGNITQAMRDAKYSEATINNPKNLTESKGFQELMNAVDEKITPELIAEKHLALLEKEEVVTKNNMTTGEIDVISTGQIETQAVSKGLDMLYKIKGAYKTGDTNIQVNIANLIGKYGE